MTARPERIGAPTEPRGCGGMESEDVSEQGFTSPDIEHTKAGSTPAGSTSGPASGPNTAQRGQYE